MQSQLTTIIYNVTHTHTQINKTFNVLFDKNLPLYFNVSCCKLH